MNTKQKKPYTKIKVETYIPTSTAGLHGKVHVRPLAGQEPFLPTMHVECTKKIKEDYEVGTKFLIDGYITTREGSKEFVYTSYRKSFIVLK